MNEKNSPQTHGAESLAAPKKCAVVAIIGRPSVGKSTFLNAATGQKVSIVSAVPQTTRNAVRGIVNSEKGQLVFIDTPGYHHSEKKMNKRLQALAGTALEDSDAILYMLDAGRKPGVEEEDIAGLLQNYQLKTIVAVNKSDLKLKFNEDILLFIISHLPDIKTNRVISISAENKLTKSETSNSNIQTVLDSLYELAPNGEPFYPEDYYTDQEVEFRVKEIIREQAINRLYDEIPHSLYVNIADLEMDTHGKGLFVRAFLCVEQESQKGIVIGKGAAMIKTIRVESIKALRKILPYRVNLDLRVKVQKNWQTNETILDSLIN
jgi:GTP-binding protein Era